MNNNKINWFPGHMKKATDQIVASQKQIDAFIEVLDARAINQSSNNDLINIINKPIIKIALKADLSDLNQKDVDSNILLVSTKNKSDRNKIIKTIDKLFEPIILKKQAKGLLKPKFNLMVIGLPNIGKSSIINFLASKNIVKAANIPGLTKNQNRKSINDRYDIVDTPGILFKNIENIEDGYVLSLINCINKDVLNLEHIINYAFLIFNEKYKDFLYNYYNIKECDNFNEFIEQICIKYHYYLKNKTFDYERAYNKIFNDISNAKIAKVHY